MMMVRIGNVVDEFPYLSPSDILIDGGKSYLKNTTRRVKEMYERDFILLVSVCQVVKKVHKKAPPI